jgi:16S rRNA (cytosine967-C5)-methyltransferase
VLRRAASSADLMAGLDDSEPEGAAAFHSAPEWLARMWWHELGAQDARSLLAVMNEPAQTALRVNTLKSAVSETIDALQAAAEPVAHHNDGLLSPPEAVVVEGPLSEGVRRRIDAGELVPQARGSQAVVETLDPQPGERVLDLCAAPGIKTTAIAARMRNRGEIVAVERDPGRASQLREQCARLGATCVEVVEGDATEVDLGDGYDRVLVDPPCSDLGTLASRPDARWRKSPELIDRLAELQTAILQRAAGTVARGGTLVYSVCTISEREGAERIRELLDAGGPQAVDLGRASPELADVSDSRFLQLRPDRDRTDGFFIAELERS